MNPGYRGLCDSPRSSLSRDGISKNTLTAEELLDIDREYREKAAAGKLRRIAPQRFNPSGEAWLPVLHSQRAERHYTVLFSNTARAHQMDMTGDWVVLYYDSCRTIAPDPLHSSSLPPPAARRHERHRCLCRGD
jgi:hypothetical protein